MAPPQDRFCTTLDLLGNLSHPEKPDLGDIRVHIKGETDGCRVFIIETHSGLGGDTFQ